MSKASGNPDVYDVFVALHVLSAVVGFAAVGLNGIYGMSARRMDRPEVSEETRRYFARPSRAEYLLLLVPVFGAAAIAVRPGGGHFGDLWVVAGLALWVVAAAILLVAVRPAERVIRERLPAPVDPAVAVQAQGDPDPGLVRAATRLAWAAAATDVLFVVALGFMITQPA